MVARIRRSSYFFLRSTASRTQPDTNLNNTSRIMDPNDGYEMAEDEWKNKKKILQTFDKYVLQLSPHSPTKQ